MIDRDFLIGVIAGCGFWFMCWFVPNVTIPTYNHFFAEKTTVETKQALPIEAVRTHEPEYKWVEYQRNRDTIYLYRVPIAVKIVADSTTQGTGKLIIQYSYK